MLAMLQLNPPSKLTSAASKPVIATVLKSTSSIGSPDAWLAKFRLPVTVMVGDDPCDVSIFIPQSPTSGTLIGMSVRVAADNVAEKEYIVLGRATPSSL